MWTGDYTTDFDHFDDLSNGDILTDGILTGFLLIHRTYVLTPRVQCI